MIRTIVIAVILVMSVVAGTAHAEAIKAVVLLKNSANGRSTASFGRGATDGGAVGRTLSAVLSDAGATVVSAGGAAPRLGDVPKGLPIGDPAALEMARNLGAGVVVIAGAMSMDAGVIRATKLVVQRAQLKIRVLDAKTGGILLTQTVTRSGYGGDAAQAAGLALSTAMSEISPGIAGAIRSLAPDSGKRSAGNLQITISGAESWGPVSAVLARLASTQGVQAVNVLRLGRQRVLLGVASPLSIPSMVGSLRRTRVRNGTISVRATGSGIAIQVQAKPSLTPLTNG